MHPRFTSVDPDRKVILTYDFSLALPAGVTLSGSPTVAVTVEFGTDATPNAIVTSSQISGALVYVAVAGMQDQTDYAIKVDVPTSNASISMAYTKVLPVRS